LAQEDPNEDLADRFVRAAREAYLNERPLEFDFNQIILIARDSASRSKFQRLCRSNENPELQDCILEYLQDVLDKLEAHLDLAENVVGLIDLGGIGVALAAIGAGLAATLTIGLTAGSIFLLGGSILSFGLCGVGRFRVKSQASQRKADAKHVRRLFSTFGKQES
jgi:hypothetical protein